MVGWWNNVSAKANDVNMAFKDLKRYAPCPPALPPMCLQVLSRLLYIPIVSGLRPVVQLKTDL